MVIMIQINKETISEVDVLLVFNETIKEIM
jgi:hypothetical protein